MAGLVYLLAFSGGFVIMALELMGGRLLAPYFGSDIYVWGSIITVFMLSLSLGYLIGGRLTLRPTSLFRLGLIFSAAAVLLYPLMLISEPTMEWIFGHIEDPRYGSLTACLFLFFIPTVILGMISPYCVRLLVDNTASAGAVAGRLYFVSTLGSALGTLLTSFYLVLWFEMNQVLLALAATLLFLGLLALLLGRGGSSVDSIELPLKPSAELA